MSMELTVIADGEYESVYTGEKIRVEHDDVRPVIYLAHVPGGMVRVRFDDREWIAHPHCFKELQ